MTTQKPNAIILLQWKVKLTQKHKTGHKHKISVSSGVGPVTGRTRLHYVKMSISKGTERGDTMHGEDQLFFCRLYMACRLPFLWPNNYGCSLRHQLRKQKVIRLTSAAVPPRTFMRGPTAADVSLKCSSALTKTAALHSCIQFTLEMAPQTMQLQFHIHKPNSCC